MTAPNVVRAMLVALLFSGLQVQSQSTVYRWVDKDGKVQFSDAPPPADAANVTSKSMGGGYVEGEQLPYATQMAMRRHPVVLYSGDQCGEVCAQARAALTKRGVPFTEKNAEKNPADAKELKDLTGELKVPVLKVGANTLKGYLEESWQSALDEAGYARTRLPGQPGPRPQ